MSDRAPDQRTPELDPAVARMEGAAALPRKNGELIFEAPWQGRAFGMALAVVERLAVSWSEFQKRLIASIAARPDAPYYESWVAALETLVVDYRLASSADVDAASRRIAAED